MTSEAHKDLGSIWAAIAVVQREAPEIKKTDLVDTTKEGGKIKYAFAGFNAVWDAIAQLMEDLGLVWSGQPDVLTLDGGQTRFVLRYTLMHLPTGQSLTGCYPLAGDSPQKIGGAITYGRRYALVAVLNLRVINDDDDAQKAEADAQLSPSDVAKGNRTPRQTAQRKPARPRQAPPSTVDGEEPKPEPNNPNAPASKATRNMVFALVRDELGLTVRDHYLAYINEVLAKHQSGPVGSTNDLTQLQAGWVIEAAEAATAGPPPEEPGDPAESEG